MASFEHETNRPGTQLSLNRSTTLTHADKHAGRSL